MRMTTADALNSGQQSKRLRILVYRIGELGDTIIALPVLWAVRRAFPEAALTYLVSAAPGSGYVAPQSVLPPEGLIDEWLTYSLESPGRVVGMVRLWHALRQRRFDTLVYLAPRLRWRPSVWRDLLFFRLAGIRRVVGHRGFYRLPARRPGVSLPSAEHEADHLLRRAELGGIPVPPVSHGEMNLALSSSERQCAQDWLRTHVPGYPHNVTLVGIGPGSKWPSKIWPEERFAELGARLVGDLGLYPLVFGGLADRELAVRLIKKWGCGVSAAGALDIRAAASVLAHCRIYVGNDTGTTHLAAAVGTPCVAIFSAQDWPGRWYPYGRGHTVLRQSVPCEGCLLSVCTKQAMRCLKEITTDDVMSACRRALGRKRDLHPTLHPRLTTSDLA
jgi:heptosyltransferase III